MITRWRDEESFQAWLGSESFAYGHAPPPRGRAARPRAGRAAQRGVVLHRGRRIRSPLSFEGLFGPGRWRVGFRYSASRGPGVLT